MDTFVKAKEKKDISLLKTDRADHGTLFKPMKSQKCEENSSILVQIRCDMMSASDCGKIKFYIMQGCAW